MSRPERGGDRADTLIETLRLAAVFCEPFIPAAAGRIAAELGLPGDERSRSPGGVATPLEHVCNWGPALFPKK